jgi:hypothetical protein
MTIVMILSLHFGIFPNTTFQKLDQFPSSDMEGGKIPTQLGATERANLNNWTNGQWPFLLTEVMNLMASQITLLE